MLTYAFSSAVFSSLFAANTQRRTMCQKDKNKIFGNFFRFVLTNGQRRIIIKLSRF